MPIKPYSFRYPYDINVALEPWRNTLRDNYEQVVANLRDRDRAIEDYLSLGIGQGQLGVGLAPIGSVVLTTTLTTISGMTVTAAVPPNRLIKVTAHIRAIHATGVNNVATFCHIVEDGVSKVFDYFTHGSAGQTAGTFTYDVTYFYTPAAGVHTWECQMNKAASADNYSTETISTGSSFISVEDVGPASR